MRTNDYCAKHEFPAGMGRPCPDCVELAKLTLKLESLPYIVETKSTDGVGGWSDWHEIARFKYPQYAKQFVRMVKSYQHEEAAIDQVQIRALDSNGQEIMPKE